MRSIALLLLLLATALTLQTASIANGTTAPGSFLRHRAASVNDLVYQISNDRTVRMIYARHFNVDPTKVANQIKNGLKLTALAKPIKVQSWYVSKDGSTEWKIKLLPKGSLVFIGSDGKPLLAWSCGNPLRASLPHQTLKNEKKDKAAGASEMPSAIGNEKSVMAGPSSDQDNVETKVLAAPVETIGTEPLAAAPGMVDTADAAVLDAAEPMVVAQAFPAAIPALIAAAPAAAGGLSAIGLIGGLGGLAGLVGGLSSSKHNSPVVPVIPPTAVPEPNGILILMTGISLSAAAIRRRKLSRM